MEVGMVATVEVGRVGAGVVVAAKVVEVPAVMAEVAGRVVLVVPVALSWVQEEVSAAVAMVVDELGSEAMVRAAEGAVEVVATVVAGEGEAGKGVRSVARVGCKEPLQG